MEILRFQRDGYLEMLFDGRLDGYWAQHLAESASQVMREGTHALRLNLSKTTYISSAGIGTLVQLYKDFAAVNGSFGIVEPSASVKKILEMVGLSQMLLCGAPAAAAAPVAPGSEVYDCVAGGPLTCRLSGDPRRLKNTAFTEAESASIALGETSMALGLGALGEGFSNCRDRFGEFLAIAGAAAYQPTDGTNIPDYMVSTGSFVPQVTALYSLCCQGSFSKLLRFEEQAPLSGIVEKALAAAGARTAAVVILAESAGLIGAMLKRSPVGGESMFGFPGVQGWLSFSPERSWARHLVLLAGVASTAPEGALQPFLRPLARASALSGHFHAAAFGYRPLQKGRLDLRTAVRSLFDAGGPQAVLHVLGDDRERGAGESEFLRGACWTGPIGEVAA
jgi:anti-anti-sigma factor